MFELHYVQNARRAGEHRLVDALQLAAGDRAGGDRGEHHAGNLRVDAELGRAVGLGGYVYARQRPADEGELSRRLDRRLLGELDLCRVGSDLAVAQRAARRLCVTTLAAAAHSAGGTSQRAAAAAIRRSRALAPTCCIFFCDARTDRLPLENIGP